MLLPRARSPKHDLLQRLPLTPPTLLTSDVYHPVLPERLPPPRSVQESDTRHDLLDQVAAKSTAQVRTCVGWLWPGVDAPGSSIHS